MTQLEEELLSYVKIDSLETMRHYLKASMKIAVNKEIDLHLKVIPKDKHASFRALCWEILTDD